jgi:hypothetical protein
VTGNKFRLPSYINEQMTIDYRDIFQSVVFSGRWNVQKYVSVQAELPFVFNKRTGTENLSYNGLGDIIIGVSGMTPKIKYRNIFHVFYFGFNTCFPTGEFKKSIDTTGFSPLIQPGNAAWQFIPQFEYHFGIKSFTASIGAFYRYALPNRDNLQIGGRSQFWLRAAYNKKVKTNRFIPSVSLIYDYFQKNRFREAAISLSGGNLLSAEAAFDVRIKEKYGIGIRFRQPVFQSLAKSHLNMASFSSIQFNYFF